MRLTAEFSRLRTRDHFREPSHEHSAPQPAPSEHDHKSGQYDKRRSRRRCPRHPRLPLFAPTLTAISRLGCDMRHTPAETAGAAGS